MEKPIKALQNKKRELYISDTEQDIIEKPSKFYHKEDIPIRRNFMKSNMFLKIRSFRKVLSYEDLDFKNKIWIGYYLDICLKKRKKYVLFFTILKISLKNNDCLG